MNLPRRNLWISYSPSGNRIRIFRFRSVMNFYAPMWLNVSCLDPDVFPSFTETVLQECNKMLGDSSKAYFASVDLTSPSLPRLHSSWFPPDWGCRFFPTILSTCSKVNKKARGEKKWLRHYDHPHKQHITTPIFFEVLPSRIKCLTDKNIS